MPCCPGPACSLMPLLLGGQEAVTHQKQPLYPRGIRRHSVRGVHESRGKGQKTPCHVHGMGTHQHQRLYLVPSSGEGACRVDTGVWGGSWTKQGSGSQVWPLPSPLVLLGAARGEPWCDELPGLSPEGGGGVRELARCPGEATVEKRLEQCTNPFILLVCQRLVRAGWSQHVCRAPSHPPPPREVPGEQLGAVAEEAQGGGSTVWQGTGWGDGVPLCPPTGVQAAAPGTYPGCLPRDPFSLVGGGGGNQALPAWDWPGSSRPRAGFIAGGRAGSPAVRRGGSRHNAVGSPGDSGGLREWGAVGA